ncbi:hypothetical protein [Tissierella sp.]|uniref:hypothetical protein n=1 Tax=Tissierella sp. TaxID=41274 RepID=UPI00285D25F9|nr:hypothetical protein [Tissierella sp.]MDR7857525.1 hypothetical protein [Tissierella sp.]
MVAKDESSKNCIMLELLKENWAHGRHVETERLDFTSIYVAIVGGTLAFIGSDFNIQTMWPIFSFLLIFSFLGFQLSKKWGNVFDAHMKKVQDILLELKDDEIKGIGFVELPSFNKEDSNLKGWKKFFNVIKNWRRTKNLFNIFYIIMMIVWFTLLILSFVKNLIY